MSKKSGRSGVVAVVLGAVLAVVMVGGVLAQDSASEPSSGDAAMTSAERYAAAERSFNDGWRTLPGDIDDLTPADMLRYEDLLVEFRAGLGGLDGSQEVADLIEAVDTAIEAIRGGTQRMPPEQSFLIRFAVESPAVAVREHFGLPGDFSLYGRDGAAPDGADVAAAKDEGPVATCCWTWWYLVDGKWRNREAWGPQPDKGNVRVGLDHRGKKVKHTIYDPGEQARLDKVGDVVSLTKKKPGYIDIVLLSASRDTRYDEDFPDGQVALEMELLKDAPVNGKQRVLYTWSLDTDGDDEEDYWVGITSDSNGDYSTVLFDVAADEGSQLEDDWPVIGDYISASVPLDAIGSPEAVSVYANAVLFRDGEASAVDRVPNKGWHRVFDVR